MEASTSADHESTSNTSEESVLVEESLDFSSPWHFSDVVLVVEDTKFHVHKSTLSMWSPVFEAMFTHQFKESTAREIPLPGKRADEVKELLKVLYSSWSRPEVTDKNCQFLLQLADEYQMDRVKKFCCEFLVKKIEVSNCLKFFKLAKKFGLDDIMEKCQQEVCYTSSADLEGSEHFNGFEPELKVDICMKVIKELERTLEEYVSTCSDLVHKVYKRVYEDFYSGIRVISSMFGTPTKVSHGFSLFGFRPDIIDTEHIQKHSELQTKLLKSLAEAEITKGSNSLDPKEYNTEKFELSCSYCIKRVQGIEWNGSFSYRVLEEPINKLYDLQQNNSVARKAMKRYFKNKYSFSTSTSGLKFGSPSVFSKTTKST